MSTFNNEAHVVEFAYSKKDKTNSKNINTNIYSLGADKGSKKCVAVNKIMARKALIIGINYTGQKRSLKGCLNDAYNLRDFLVKYYKFNPADIVMLIDKPGISKSNIPTKANIIKGMKWLVNGATKNHSLLFHFSGHGGLTKDLEGDEESGYDQTILPLDHCVSGHITDDEMNDILVKPLPAYAKLLAIFDSCHSGTALDLPYIYNTKGQVKDFSINKVVVKTVYNTASKLILKKNINKTIESVKKGYYQLNRGRKAEQITRKTKGSDAQVIMFSGCSDWQTSADTRINNKSIGALSYALMKTLARNPYNISVLELFLGIRGILRYKHTQKAQFSSSKPIDMHQLFLI